jgi:hypothetical protein
MNRACFSKHTSLHEQNQHASCIRPFKNNPVRMKLFLPCILIVITCAIACPNCLLAQTKVKYAYDGSGNRKSRNVIVLKSVKADSARTPQAGELASKKQVFTDSVGNQKILIYPNPTQGQLLVEIQGVGEETKMSLYLYNLSGGLLISKTPVSSCTPLDLTGYPIGTYILKVAVGSKMSEWKVVKE